MLWVGSRDACCVLLFSTSVALNPNLLHLSIHEKLVHLEESPGCGEVVMEKPELPDGCVESPEKVVTTIDVGQPGQPDGEGLGALLVGVLLLSSSLTVNFASLLAQSLLNALKPDATRIQTHPCLILKIPMEGVSLAPLVEKGETVGETHGEAVLGEAGALQVLTEIFESDIWSLC